MAYEECLHGQIEIFEIIVMKEINTTELKQLQLNILNDISQFCDSHHLRYYMAFGSLLGTVRHNGFIPWDDDVDIMMPRPDYEKFIKTYNTEKSSVFLQLLYPGISKKYYTTFAKVHDTRTRYQEKLCKETIYGVFVDVFPLDAYTNTFCYKMDLLLLRLASFKHKIAHNKSGMIKNMVKLLIKLMMLPVPANLFLNMANWLRRRGNFEDSSMVYSNAGITKLLPKVLLERSELHDFESLKVRIPSGYDKLLNIWYGDYLKMPPENERTLRHDAIIWWKEEF